MNIIKKTEIAMYDSATIQPKGKAEIKQAFINLRAKGHSIRLIAKELKLSPQTVLNWDGDFNEEISRLKAVELESLYEQYELTKKHRLKKVSDQLAAIQKYPPGIYPTSPQRGFWI